jgi:hypothetical protein
MIAAFGTSPADSLGYLRYMADRPAQIESAAGNLSVFLTALLGGVPETLFSYGSHNVMAPQWVLTGAQVLLVLGYLAILLLALSIARRTASPSGIGASSSTLACIGGAVVVLVLLTSKVFSGEYLIWLMPFVFLCGRRRDIVLYCAALALLKVLYSQYDLVTSAQLTGSLLVFAKNFLVASLGVSMLAGRLTRGRYWQQIRTAAV